ncbi:MAG: DNA recombination protein RmuC [bacterium]|nr:DNA recombination protein RmuC [bacterium]
MNLDTQTLILIVGGVIVAGFFFFFKKLEELKGKDSDDESTKVLMEWLKEMRSSLDKNTDTLQSQLTSTNKAINERLDNAAKIIGMVGKEVGQMSEIGRSMKDLQDFLRSPKLRGNIGEQVLRELLGQFLPKESFHLQYRFRSGDIVDAAIKTDSGVIPIDSKFPMENFKAMMGADTEAEKTGFQKDFARDVKKHIDDIAKKYILPEEGTIDYALMYVPSEPIYYEIMANMPELSEYAHTKRVLPVSPSTFYAYMRAILMSFEGKKIEERARTILASLRSIKGDSEKFGDVLRVLTKHVNDTKNTADLVNSRFLTLNSKIENAQGLPGKVADKKAVFETEPLPLDQAEEVTEV